MPYVPEFEPCSAGQDRVARSDAPPTISQFVGIKRFRFASRDLATHLVEKALELFPVCRAGRHPLPLGLRMSLTLDALTQRSEHGRCLIGGQSVDQLCGFLGDLTHGSKYSTIPASATRLPSAPIPGNHGAFPVQVRLRDRGGCFSTARPRL